MVFGLIVGIVATTWQLSLELVPFVMLAVLAGYAARERDHDDRIGVIIAGQRETALAYGLYLVAGLTVGAVIAALVGGFVGNAAAVALTVAAGYVGYRREQRPKPAAGEWASWPDAARLWWLAVPVLAVAAIVTQDALVQHLVSLVFYGVIFWEL